MSYPQKMLRIFRGSNLSLRQGVTMFTAPLDLHDLLAELER